MKKGNNPNDKSRWIRGAEFIDNYGVQLSTTFFFIAATALASFAASSKGGWRWAFGISALLAIGCYFYFYCRSFSSIAELDKKKEKIKDLEKDNQDLKEIIDQVDTTAKEEIAAKGPEIQEIIELCLKCIIDQKLVSFEDYRITVYVHEMSGGPDGQFIKLARHSDTPNYKPLGRDVISYQEGCLHAIFTDRDKEFEYSFPKEIETDAQYETHQKNIWNIPKSHWSDGNKMRPLQYVGKRVEKNSKGIGIILFEGKERDTLDSEEIWALLKHGEERFILEMMEKYNEAARKYAEYYEPEEPKG